MTLLNYKVILIWIQPETLKLILGYKQKKERNTNLRFWKSELAPSGLKVAEENRNYEKGAKRRGKKN